jgi:hypothetical protein
MDTFLELLGAQDAARCDADFTNTFQALDRLCCYFPLPFLIPVISRYSLFPD